MDQSFCYTLIDFAWDMRLLMDLFGLSRANIVSHSLGSLIVQVFVENWPDRVRRVVLISSSGGPSTHPTAEELAARKWAAIPRSDLPMLRIHAGLVVITDTYRSGVPQA